MANDVTWQPQPALGEIRVHNGRRYRLIHPAWAWTEPGGLNGELGWIDLEIEAANAKAKAEREAVMKAAEDQARADAQAKAEAEDDLAAKMRADLESAQRRIAELEAKVSQKN